MNASQDFEKLKLESQIEALEELLAVHEAIVLEQTEKLQKEVEAHKKARAYTQDLKDELEMILNSAAEGIFGMDLEGKVIFWNPAAQRMTGYSAQELRGQSVHPYIHHSHPDGTPHPEQQCRIFKHLKQGWPARYDDEIFWKKDGSHFPVEYRMHPLVENGKIKGAVLTFQDISERLEIQKKIQDSHTQVQRSLRLAAVGKLAYAICHEILNPLNIISMRLQILKRQKDAGPGWEAIAEELQEQVEIIRKITTSITKFGSSTAPRETEVDVNESVKTVLATLKKELGTGNIHIVQNLAPDVKKVLASESDLAETFSMIIQNAREAMPNGGTLKITTRSQDDSTLIEIQDTGPGIPAGDLEKVFDPFYTTKLDAPGRGLGLTLAHQTIQAMNGTLNLESTKESGLLARITLPALNPPPQ